MRQSDVVDRIVPISILSQGKAAQVLRRIADEPEIIIVKNNRPKAVILSPEQYKAYSSLAETCEDLLDEDGISKEEQEKLKALLKKVGLRPSVRLKGQDDD